MTFDEMTFSKMTFRELYFGDMKFSEMPGVSKYVAYVRTRCKTYAFCIKLTRVSLCMYSASQRT